VLKCTSAPPYRSYLIRTHTSTMFAERFHGYTARRLAANGGGQRYGCCFFRHDLRTTAPNGKAASAGHEAGGRRSATRRPRQVPSPGSGGTGGGGRAVWRVACLRGRRCHCFRRSQGVLEGGVRESVVLTGSLFFSLGWWGGRCEAPPLASTVKLVMVASLRASRDRCRTTRESYWVQKTVQVYFVRSRLFIHPRGFLPLSRKC